jgi:hypothetical protein
LSALPDAWKGNYGLQTKKNTMICELQKTVLKRKIYVEHVARKGEMMSGEIMVEKNHTKK